MKVNWTKESLHNIQEIEDYISQDNPIAAIKLIDKLISLVEDLVEFPEKGRVVPELSISHIREILYKNYRVVYLIKKNTIDILTVFEGHKLLDKENLSDQIKNN
ncbi:MAG: type II toxin-antitoxin system RelE/ParE family toxin [Ignavibacteriae bacterium]|jgi:toxin ParE1/3/4|nr:type II toxin-antitoxin system RelE/ParE family toxin [Ignavibacteriota bacterium]